jgi:hypothetical protein
VASRFQNVKIFINALAKMGFQLKRKVRKDFLYEGYNFISLLSERNWRWFLPCNELSKSWENRKQTTSRTSADAMFIQEALIADLTLLTSEFNLLLFTS